VQPLLLHVSEVCDLTGYSKAHVHRLIARGELACVRSGRAVRVPRGSLLRWIAAQSGEPVDLTSFDGAVDVRSTAPGEAA